MILTIINFSEAKCLRENLPNVCIFKTKRQKGSSKGFYYVEETTQVMKLLEKYRNDNIQVIEEYPVKK